MKPASFGVFPVIRGKIGPQEEGGRGRNGIPVVFAGHCDQCRAAAFDLSVADERACGLIGSERSQGTRISYLLELNRGLGIPIEPCQNIAVGNAVFP
jgi:hypothetical protein